MKAPALAGSKFVTGPGEGPIDTVLNGRPNTAMQPFSRQLSDTEIAAVITYARSSWGTRRATCSPPKSSAAEITRSRSAP